MRAALVGLTLALMIVSSPAGSHAQDSVRAVVDTAAAGPPRPRGPFVMPPLQKELTSHPHNKLIHFPIVLGLGAFVLLLVARRRPELLPVAHAVIWLAAVAALAAYFSGRWQEGEFKDRPKEWIAHLHGKWGTAVAIAAGVWAVLVGLRPRAYGLAVAVGVIVVMLIIVAGFYGGVVAHGH